MMLLASPAPPNGRSPSNACEDELSSLFVGSGRAELVLILPNVQRAYREYIAGKGDPGKLRRDLFPRSTADEARTNGDLLFSCYRSGRGIDREIYLRVQKVSKGKCPYCGLRLRRKPRARAYDRDHVVPRSVYPEFSILPLNLVVACDDCNDAKGSRFETQDGQGLWLHPYFDIFLQQPIVTALPTARGGTIQIVFELALDHVPSSERARARRHVEELEVLQRLSEEVNETLSVHLGTLKHLSNEVSAEKMASSLLRTGQQLLAEEPCDFLGLALWQVGSSPALLKETIFC